MNVPEPTQLIAQAFVFKAWMLGRVTSEEMNLPHVESIKNLNLVDLSCLIVAVEEMYQDKRDLFRIVRLPASNVR